MVHCIEAFAYGLPVITSKPGAMAEIVERFGTIESSAGP